MPIALREATVLATQPVTPHLLRLTLGGPDLAGGPRDGHDRARFASHGFDDHVKIVIPEADGTTTSAGTQHDGRVTWADGVLPRCRDYTVRSWQPEAGTFEIEVAKHDGGRASDWAHRAAIGDRVTFAGPKMSQLPAPGVAWHLLIADETGLPALARFLNEAPPGHRVRAFIEVPTADDRQDIATAADAEISWLIRPPGVAAGHSTQLFEAVTSFTPWPGRGFAWGGAEAMTVAPIRRWLRHEAGLAVEDIDVAGYWRRTELACVEDSDAPSPSEAQLSRDLHHLGDLMAPIVIRVAATLDLPGLIAAGHSTIDALSTSVGVDADRLRLVLDAMSSLGLVTQVGNSWHNTSVGALLTDAGVRSEFNLDEAQAQRTFAIVDLLEVVRTSRPTQRTAAARDWAEVDQAAGERLEIEAEQVAALPQIVQAGCVTVTGWGSAVVAAALLRHHRHLHVTLVCPIGRAAPATAAVAAAHPGTDLHRLTVIEERELLPVASVVIALHTLDELSPEAADQHSRRLMAAARDAVVVLSRGSDHRADDDHQAEAALVTLATTGEVSATPHQLGELLARAGADEVSAGPLGWGFGSTVITGLRQPQPPPRTAGIG